MQVLLPKTEFPMKGNLAQTEPARVADWLKNDLYRKIMSRPAKKGLFVMPDGPPYANGKIHVGTVLNKVLKDIVIKYKNLAGYKAAFIPGWDCHGLPIELNVTKKLGAKRAELSDADIRGLCREEAMKWVGVQKEQFQRLGVLADWQNPYLTLHPQYEADEIRVLAKILENGVFYRGEKPVYWCPALQTALAAAEVEYRPHKSLSIFVKFKADSPLPGLESEKKPVSYLIWTTTPWTLPANTGLAVNASLVYGYFDTGSEILVLAKDLKESVEAETGLKLKSVGEVIGAKLERLKAKHPFIDRTSLVILGDHVTLEAGSGVVHTAPGHGLDDYVAGLRYGLAVLSPVDGAGKYTEEVPEFVGEKIWDANPKIVEKLKSLGQLVSVKEIEHSYPHNPRSKTPLIFRATPQWFVRLDDEKFPLRQKCLEATEKDIKFIPGWGQQRLVSMVSNSPDWCLSRQRIWGVPVPVFYCEKCETPLVNSEVMNRLADAMESSQKGIEAYHTNSTAEFTKGHSCEKCGTTSFKTGKDILDVWFDSGVAHTAVQRRRDELATPADIYLEGSDQHRGWFQTSLISSMAAYGEAPFKTLITHGFVTDAQGYKMSKSLGNTVDPEEIIKESGAEILRLWVAHEDYGQDLTIGKEMIRQISDTYRRFRNTIRFMLGNLNDFDPSKDRVAYEDMTPLDKWALNQFAQLIENCTQAYDRFEFHKVYHGLNTYFALDLSAIYLDVLKDRLYTGRADGVRRRAAQSVLYDVVSGLCGLMAPIASFLAEETYSYIPKKSEASVFLTDFPVAESKWRNSSIGEDFSELLEVRAEISKVLEDLRRQKVIGSSLDAKVTLTLNSKQMSLFEKYRAELKELLIVSQIEMIAGETLKISAARAEGEKCERCWHYDPMTGKDSRFPGVCSKCVAALE